MRALSLLLLGSLITLSWGFAIDISGSAPISRRAQRLSAPNGTVYTCAGVGVFNAQAYCCIATAGCTVAPTPFVCPDTQIAECQSATGSGYAITAHTYTCPVSGYAVEGCCDPTNVNSCVSPPGSTFRCGNVTNGRVQYRYPNCCSDKTYKKCWPLGAMVAPIADNGQAPHIEAATPGSNTSIPASPLNITHPPPLNVSSPVNITSPINGTCPPYGSCIPFNPNAPPANTSITYNASNPYNTPFNSTIPKNITGAPIPPIFPPRGQ